VSYRRLLDGREWLPEFGVPRERRDVHAVFVPEMALDLEAEAARLRQVMDEVGNVNIFLSEGAGVDSIVAQMEAAGEEVPRDAFGHVRLNDINPGTWFAETFAPMIDAGKVLVQKSGYYSRAAAANERDLELIKSCVDTAVDTALAGGSGLVGHDEERGDVLRAIEFERIKGGKNFDIDVAWFGELLEGIGQPKRAKVAVEH
jgi:pyrophosphate--fructose-6-phosphate 1-phosphotransferase